MPYVCFVIIRLNVFTKQLRMVLYRSVPSAILFILTLLPLSTQMLSDPGCMWYWYHIQHHKWYHKWSFNHCAGDSGHWVLVFWGSMGRAEHTYLSPAWRVHRTAGWLRTQMPDAVISGRRSGGASLNKRDVIISAGQRINDGNKIDNF